MEKEKEKPTVSSPTSTALLCGSKIGTPTITYRDKDQKLINKSKGILQDYEKSLMHRIRRDGINWAATEQEMYSQFINDEIRIKMTDTLVKYISVLIPIQTIYTLTT